MTNQQTVLGMVHFGFISVLIEFRPPGCCVFNCCWVFCFRVGSNLVLDILGLRFRTKFPTFHLFFD
jgi:hypothetical protein